jgi:hypothetical protein
MTEVRQEVICATAALVAVLLGVIGYQALNSSSKKAPFNPKKATCEPKAASGSEEKKSAPVISNVKKNEGLSGKILEK